MFETDPLPSLKMSPEEITQLATLNIARIHESAAMHLGQNTSVEASLAILNMTASLCFPNSYAQNAAEAIGMVNELLDLLPKGA